MKGVEFVFYRRGFVINVASDSALASTAEWGYYAGSKAYMTLYTEAMQRGQFREGSA